MAAQHLALSGDDFARSIGQRFTLLRKIRIDELFVVTAGNKADFLGVRLLCQRKLMLARNIAHCWFGHLAQGKTRPAELLLSKSKQEIGLVLSHIGGALEQPAIALGIKLAARVMAGS